MTVEVLNLRRVHIGTAAWRVTEIGEDVFKFNVVGESSTRTTFDASFFPLRP